VLLLLLCSNKALSTNQCAASQDAGKP